MPRTPNPHLGEPLIASNIPLLASDGSALRSTFYLSVLTPLMLAAALIIWLFARNLAGFAGGVSLLVLLALVHFFPAQASAKFMTFTENRPIHFIPTLVSLCSVSCLAVYAGFEGSTMAAYGLTSTMAGHFAAFFLAMALVTSGRYAFNCIEMTQRLLILLACAGGSAMVQDQSLLMVGVLGLGLNLLWRMHTMWTPKTTVTPMASLGASPMTD